MVGRIQTRPARLLASIVVASCWQAAWAEDWPTWRHDAQRSAASAEELPAKLSVRWVRELPPVAKAWPNESRLHFDPVYEPVIAGKRMFLASPNDGSIRAYDTETGRERWRFFTDGPARFAPAVWRGRVFAVSDDGYLYALDAKTGKELWRVNGADLPTRRHLGNNRLVSWRVARGGPVVADGVVYFAAGIWPTMGVFVRAVDAMTGKPVWTNSDGYWLPKVRIDHNYLKDAALSPQGYLLVNGDRVLVPNGRSMPARFDRRTGKLQYFVQGYRRGHCRVTTMGNYAFVGQGAVVDVTTGREVGSKWAAAGKDAPNAFDARKFDLFEGPMFGYKFMPACSAWSVLTPTRVYGIHRGVLYAYDLTQPKISEYVRKQGGRELKPWRWDLPEVWRLNTRLAGKRGRGDALIKAGNRLYGHVGRTLFAADLPRSDKKPPKVAWSLALEAEPASMAAADGKLFVSTPDGKILCLGKKPSKVRRWPLKAERLPKPASRTNRKAAAVLKAAGVSEGFAVLLGVEDPMGLAAALLDRSKLRVIVVDPDAARVQRMRDKLVAAGVYGSRVEVFAGDPMTFDLPPYLASLVVARTDAAGRARRLFDILRPYGGTACVDTSDAEHAALAQAAKKEGLENAKVERVANLSLLRRVGPLKGSAYWTHECADAARSYFSRDTRVKAPLGVLWYGDGPGYGFYKRKDYGSGIKPQVAGGRVVALRQSRPSTLCAIDAYTGRELWTRKVGRFTVYVTMPEAVYVADGDALIVLDPATGQERLRATIDTGHPKADEPTARVICVDGSMVVIGMGFGNIQGGAYMMMQVGGLWDSKMLVGLDRQTGKQLWRKEAQERFNKHAVAMGDGMVFCTDSLSPVKGWQDKQRGIKHTEVESTIMVLDARTGELKWKQTETNPYRDFPPGNWLGQRSSGEWVAYSKTLQIVLAGRTGRMYAFDAATGKLRWKRPGGGAQPLIVRDKTFLTQAGAVFEIATGNRVGKRTYAMRKHGCNYAVASKNLILRRDATVSYTDLNSPEPETYWLRNVRSGCSASLIAADGLLNVPCFATGCVCNYSIQTSFALLTLPDVARWAKPAR